MRKILTVMLSFTLLFSAAACSDDKEVGSGIDVEDLSEKSKALGEIEEKDDGGFVGDQEAEAQEKAEAEAKAKAAAAAAEAEKQAEKQIQENAVKVSITTSGYDPYYIRVFEDGVVQFTNKDKVVRNVTGEDNAFNSGDIAPGATWTFRPTAAGKFNFADKSCVETRSGTCGVRQSTIGTLEVIAR
jgi:plastocyanin